MHRLIFTLVLAASTILTLTTVGVDQVRGQSDDYWTNHWNWHNNTYSPYQRRYYSNYTNGSMFSYPHSANSIYPGYGNYGVPNYGNFGYPYPAYGYGNYGYGNYYGAPNAGFYQGYGNGGAVRVGPMTFGWR